MSFLIEDENLSQKYNNIWDKTVALLLEKDLIFN